MILTLPLSQLLAAVGHINAAPMPITDTSICAGQTYRCSSSRTSIEVCNPAIGWRLEANCAGASCQPKDGVPHCFDSTDAAEHAWRKALNKRGGVLHLSLVDHTEHAGVTTTEDPNGSSTEEDWWTGPGEGWCEVDPASREC
ncbi:hypothetical protein E8E13_000046 [Curvularia kusanoi]|uniref:Secreted protein n=1 Tax=Curvularia kusanoi TaxID=90978 RepID=A0A9P4T570_CURKU|nr:hypothetical protein E8E13_000046 [Curvularia kusanoi]